MKRKERARKKANEQRSRKKRKLKGRGKERNPSENIANKIRFSGLSFEPVPEIKWLEKKTVITTDR